MPYKTLKALHHDETFYAFCITGSLLSLNSEEAFAEKLAYYQAKYPRYKEEDWKQGLKSNSGDWKYQGFAAFSDEHGFDTVLHDEHYNLHFPLSDGQTLTTEYSVVMDKVMELLVQRDAFGPLKRTKAFSISREEYD